MKMSKLNRYLVRSLLIAAILLGINLMSPPKTATASADSCTAPATTYGTDTMTVNIPSAGTYYIWTRMQAPATTSNEILLNVNNTCFDVGNSTSIPNLNSWTWVNKSSTNNVISMALPSGNSTFTLTGIEGGVSVDRIEALTDDSCVPTDTGDNCTPATPVDTTPPTVTVSSSVGAVTNSTSANFTLDGTDNVTASDALTYQCSLDNAAYTSCTSPKAYSGLAAGDHSFNVKATDQAGNVSTPANYSWTVDTTPPSVSISVPASGATVSGTLAVAADASDNVKVDNVQFKLDGETLGSPVTSSPYTYSLNTSTLSNGTHSISAVATDTAGNTTTSSPTTFTVNNSNTGGSVTPPVPTGLAVDSSIYTTATTISLDWNADTGGSGGTLDGYKLLRNGQQIAILSSSTTSYTDYFLTVGTQYSYTLEAYDTDGNTSSASSTLNAKTITLIGDLDGNGVVTGHDLSILLTYYGKNYVQGEFDGTNVVEGHDLSLLLSNYGT
jgi:hypothetical protein